MELIKISPKFFISDFEIGLINRIKTVFPNCVQKGCNFHLTQSIWKKIQSLGLSKLYKEGLSFFQLIRSLFSLAFLKEEDIENEFLVINKNCWRLKMKKLKILLNIWNIHTSVS
jgi:hypothetical protein